MGWRDLWDPERGLLPNDPEFQRAKTYLGDAWKGAGNALMQGVGVAAGALPGGWKGLTTLMRGGSLDEAVKGAQATTMAIAEPITGAFAQETGQGGRDLERALMSRMEGWNDITSGVGSAAEAVTRAVPVIGPSAAPWVAGAAKTAADFAPVSPGSWVEGAQALGRKAAATNQWGVVVPPNRRGLPFASARRENPAIVEKIPADLRSDAIARAFDEAVEKKLGKGEPPPPPIDPGPAVLPEPGPPQGVAPLGSRDARELTLGQMGTGDVGMHPYGPDLARGNVYEKLPGGKFKLLEKNLDDRVFGHKYAGREDLNIPMNEGSESAAAHHENIDLYQIGKRPPAPAPEPQPRVFPGLREDIIPLGSKDAGELTLGQMEPGYVGVHPYSAADPNQYAKLPNGKFVLIHEGERGAFRHGEGPQAGQPMHEGSFSDAARHGNIDLLQAGRLPEWEGYKPPTPPEPIPQQSMVKATRQGQIVTPGEMKTGEFGRPPHKETAEANIYHKGPKGNLELYKRQGAGKPLHHKAGIRQGEVMRAGSVTNASDHPGFELNIIGRDPSAPGAAPPAVPARFPAGQQVRIGDLLPGEGFEGNNGGIYRVEPNGRYKMIKAGPGVGFRHEAGAAMKEGSSSVLDQTLNRHLKKAYVPPDEVARIAGEQGYGPKVPGVPNPVVEKAAQLAAEKGGMTMLLGKGAKPEAIAEHGWAYVPGQGHEKVLSHAPGAETMGKFLDEQKRYVKQLGEWGDMAPQPALGDWKSPGGRHHLEIGVVAKPEDKALALRKAQEAKQQAIFHLSAGEEVPVPKWKIPGTGEQASMIDLGEGDRYSWDRQREAKRKIGERGGEYNPLAAQKILEKETPGRILESREVERNLDVGGPGGAIQRQPSDWGTGQPLVANVDRAEKVYRPPELSDNDFINRPVLPGMADPRQKQFWRQGEHYRPQGRFGGGYFGRVEKPADHTAALAAEAKEQIKAKGGVQKPHRAKAINALLEQADDAAIPRETQVHLGGPGGAVDAAGNPLTDFAMREVPFNPGVPEGQENLPFMREVLREYAGEKLRADRRAADLSPYHTPGGGVRQPPINRGIGPNDLDPEHWANIEARRGPVPNEAQRPETATGQMGFQELNLPGVNFSGKKPGDPQRAIREAMERQRPSEERQRLWNIMRDERVDPSWTRLPYEEGGPKHRWKGEGKLGDQPVYGSAHTDKTEARAAFERRYGQPPRHMTEGDYDKPLSGTTLQRVAKEAKEKVDLRNPPGGEGRPGNPDYLWGRTTKFMEREAAKIDALEIAEPGKPVAGKELPPELAKALESPSAEKEFEAAAGEERARQMKKFSIAGTGMKNTGRFSNGVPDPRFPAGQIRYFHDWRRGHLNWETPGGYGRYMEPDGIRGAPPGWENGFVTKDGRFITREQWEEIVGGRYSEHGKDGTPMMGTSEARNQAKNIEKELADRYAKHLAEEEAKMAAMSPSAKAAYLREKRVDRLAWEVQMGITQIEGGVPFDLRSDVAKKAGVKYKPKKKKK